MARADALTQKQGRDEGRQDRLEPDDQSGNPRIQSVPDRKEDAAEIGAMDEAARDDRMERLAPLRPGHASERGQPGQDREGQGEAKAQKGKRLGIGHRIASADEASRPEQNEKRWKQPDVASHGRASQ